MTYLQGLAAVATVGACYWLFSSLPREQVLGEFSTDLSERSRNQRHNARLALQEIMGAEIGPGEEFSFNQRLKGWTFGDGYRKAPVSYNGQLIDSWGGGVCQTSTTLYNAALLAGMEVTQRHTHRFAPSYITPGRDAAVAYENIDLKFKNPFPYTVKIVGSGGGNRLIIQLMGVTNSKPSVSIESVIEHKLDPRRVILGDSGRRVIRNSGKPGYLARTFRWVDGERKQVSEDYYPAMDQVIEYR